MRTSSFQSLKNHFLIATPQMADPSFAETLTLICEHSKDGALGVVINRPTELMLGEIFRQVGIEYSDTWAQSQSAVYAGGPVASERGFVLHSNDRLWESSLNVGEDINLTTSKDILVAMANNEGPSHTLVALGYAGWGAGQLEQEMAENTWLTCAATPAIIFTIPYEQRLTAAAASLGVDLHLLSGQVGHA
ncbi:YqgE/AlgH family protein [Endozoicomonas lisbonensis]|uniref:UPF0301 protein V5J35_002797 n=1 Tax=Endozoicomonas lisbonensis TaxID=3120522 RepID=A0ABV2SIM8_9GAMM